MAKKIKAVVRLQLEAGKASPAPPVGPALAAHGVNLMGFCKEYNAKTQNRTGEIIPADISIKFGISLEIELSNLFVIAIRLGL